MSTKWETSNAEPSLDEVLSDPIVRLLMQGDRTGESDVRKLIEQVRISLAETGTDGETGNDGQTISAPARAVRKTKKPRKTHAA